MSTNDRRLIEDFLPIKEISAEASREKSLRHGHISTLHLWWARRPLVACRAAVYASLVPADFHAPKNGPENKRASLGRANAAKFLKELCRYPGNPQKIEEAKQNILKAHFERTGKKEPPKVLDCFAGGGAIPLEALRLGCEAYALELNPVAHLIELCTLVYPQKFGKPDPNSVGCEKGKWAGLAKEVEYWGKWVLEKVRNEIGDLYPPIPDPKDNKIGSTGILPVNKRGFQPVQENLFITQRNLPHWQLGGSTYFVTFRTANIELPRSARNVVLEACRHFDGKRYHLWVAVVMPDHTHLLLTPMEQKKGEWYSLSQILHSIKSFSAKQINKLLNRERVVWQDESFDRIVRDEKEFLEKWEYIRNNAVKKGLSETPEEYESLYESTGKHRQDACATGYLTPVAYLWTRTVPCKNPGCGAVVPLVRQTWLCKKPGRYIALRISPSPTSSPTNSSPSPLMGENSSSYPSPLMGEGKGGGEKLPIFTVVQSSARSESQAIEEFGFNPGEFSKGGNAACIFCGTVADTEYVKQQGQMGRMERQLMAVVCSKAGETGKVYLSGDNIPTNFIPDDEKIEKRISKFLEKNHITLPNESMPPYGVLGFRVQPYGFPRWRHIFISRQLFMVLTFTKWVSKGHDEMCRGHYDPERSKAITTSLGLWVDKIADYGTSNCRWIVQTEAVANTLARQALPMMWDFAELSPFSQVGSNAPSILESIIDGFQSTINYYNLPSLLPADVTRGNATELPYADTIFDVVVTDPPYYDNIPYSDLSDFYYIWLKRSIGTLYPEHFASELTPKKNEAIADPYRHTGKEKAKKFYEEMMFRALREMHRVLKSEGILTMVYAHKTVTGWSTLVNALRKAGFIVTEAWPLQTERPGRLREIASAALASSIFLIARKRGSTGFQPVTNTGRIPVRNIGKMPVPPVLGSYKEVKAELEAIVRERVQTLWDEGITGADLIIACVGAGLKAFTQYERIELPNGDEVSSERFLTEVEGVVQETILEFLFGSKSKVSAVDTPTRFYILWRYAYGRGEIDAGEAIVFSYPLGVELDGSQGLSTGKFALLEKKGKKYLLKDYSERGEEEHLGIEPRFGITEKPLIDVLHRLLWLMENRTLLIKDFLDQAMPNTEELRLVAQALSGSSLQGGGLKLTTDAEQSALQKLLSNWRSVVEDNLFRKR
jgi:putative DNA methylase